MDPVISAVTELSHAFEAFKYEQAKKMDDFERKSLKYNRFDNLAPENFRMDNSVLKAFKTYLAKGDDRPLQEITQKSLSTTDAEGGYLIPPTIEARLHQHVEDYSPIRRLSNVVTISSTALELLLDSKEPDAGWSEETANRDVTDTPEMRKIRIVAHELYARPRATERLLADASSSVEDWLTQAVAKKMAQLENYAFIYGDGNNKPQGFLNYPTAAYDDWGWGSFEHILTGANNRFVPDTAADKLLETIGALKPLYLKGAVWVMSRPAFVAIQKVKDGEGKYVVQPGNIQEQRPILFGYPVEIVEDMPGFGENPCCVAFGNFKEAYQIVEHQGTHILRDPYSAKPFVEFYTTRRVGGDVINFEALKILRFSNA